MTNREGYDLLQSDPKWQKYTAEGKEATKKLIWALDNRLKIESKILGHSHYDDYKSDPEQKVAIMGWYFFKWLGQYAKWYPGAHIKKPTAIATIFMDKDHNLRHLSNDLGNYNLTRWLLQQGVNGMKIKQRKEIVSKIKKYFGIKEK